MTPFENALGFTLRWETGGREDGGLVDHPDDPGGLTRWGISQRAYPALDIRALTREQATDIYVADYWLVARCNEMPVRVACAHFDCAVHSGPSRAAKLLQQAIGAPIDGRIGGETLDHLRSFIGGRGDSSVALRLVDTRARWLVDLERRQSRWTFLEGFVVRLVALAGFVVKED